METIKVSIVIPAHNERDSIGKVIADVKTALKGYIGYLEIIVVDDGSSDDTAKKAEMEGVQVIANTQRMGSGFSRKLGIQRARGDIVVMIDADGTYDAQSIPQMLQYFPEADQVIGARTSEKGGLKILRWFAKGSIRQLASYLVGCKIPDLNSGLRAFKKDIMCDYFPIIPDGFSCVSSMTLAFLSNRHTVKWVPTQYFKRIGKSKFHPLKDTYNYLLTVIRMIMYFNPLKVFFPLSIFMLLFGIIKTLYDYFFLIQKMLASDIVIIVVSVIVGVLGLIADLVVARGKLLQEFIRNRFSKFPYQ